MYTILNCFFSYFKGKLIYSPVLWTDVPDDILVQAFYFLICKHFHPKQRCQIKFYATKTCSFTKLSKLFYIPLKFHLVLGFHPISSF